jgi:primosomal protein N' (replication factor Y)
MPTFADIILPLAIPNALTYEVPEEFAPYLLPGMRVVVPLGKNKRYVGIVIAMHEEVPSAYDPKCIESLIDEYPIVTEKQIKLWFWVADYYLCHIGEVMQSALPPGLKFDEETTYVIADDVELNNNISPLEQEIIEELAANGSQSWEELNKKIKSTHFSAALQQLLKKKLLLPQQEVKKRFKPKTIDVVLFQDPYHQIEACIPILQELEKGAKKQYQLLQFLVTKANNEAAWEGNKREILQESNCHLSQLNALVEKGIVTIKKKSVDRILEGLIAASSLPELSDAQQAALLSIQDQWKQKPIVLLNGITGSGKTAVYAHLIEEQLQQGKQVLFLLPEIALTTQIVQRLKALFGIRAGVYHSGYSGNERAEIWSKIITHQPGEYDIIIGARSAIFLPFERLGLIIVDEEHDASYKQQDPAPRYHGRDAAIVLSQFHQCPILLGSATPSLESYKNADGGRYGYVELTTRFGHASLPKIELINLLEARQKDKMRDSFSQHLIDNIGIVLNNNQQVILFQNRRGYTPQWQCQTCGQITKCTRCDVSLTYHKKDHHLECHYCGYKTIPPKQCGTCHSSDLKMLGSGTEKIEEEITNIFPDKIVQRLDGDTTRNKNSQAEIVERVMDGEIDILVGTQMVTKGLDFENVTLVGVIHADRLLAFPDFRAIERTFQLLTQVAGRAGRSKAEGKVLIQTTQPEHWIYPLVMDNNYLEFYKKESNERFHFGYPPYVRLVKLTLKNKKEEEIEETAQYLAQRLHEIFKEGVLGPEKPFVSKINNYHLRIFTIKLAMNKELVENKMKIYKLVQTMKVTPPHNRTRVNIDVDPQ